MGDTTNNSENLSPPSVSPGEGQGGGHRASEIAPPLSYQSIEMADPSHKPPLWVWIIVIVYALLFLALLGAPIWIQLLGNFDHGSIMRVSIVATILTACGVALMITPVRKSRHRPVTRRSIWIPVIASGLLMGGLAYGALLLPTEYFRLVDEGGNDPPRTTEQSNRQDQLMWSILAAAIGVWIVWSIVFTLMTRTRDPYHLGMNLHRILLAGSLAELLIAVPTHIVVRRRAECCAGLLSGFAIAIGAAVMIIAFGPSVYLLYRKRWKQIANR
jgi:hypothetical protein